MHKEEAYYNSDGEKVFSRTTQFSGRFHDNRGYSFYAYGKSINFRIKSYPLSVTKLDIANLVLLAHQLQLDTNVLTYRSNKGKKAMGIVQMGKVIGIGERQTQRFIKRMMDLGIMKKTIVTIVGGKEVRYVMNPIYFLNGKHISDTLYWTFKEELDKILPTWVQEEYRKRQEEGVL